MDALVNQEGCPEEHTQPRTSPGKLSDVVQGGGFQIRDVLVVVRVASDGHRGPCGDGRKCRILVVPGGKRAKQKRGYESSASNESHGAWAALRLLASDVQVQ